MATATQSITLSSAVNKIWRKVQGDLQTAIQYGVEEYDQLDELTEYNIDWSTREITTPLDINEGAGIASIPEGGYEARPSSPNVEEITLTWILLNGTFTLSKTARWIDQQNREAMIERQIVHQARHKIRDLQRRVGDQFWGYSTGIVALTDTDISGTTATLVLKSGFGDSTVTNAAYIANLFKVGDYIAVLNAGTLVTNAIGVITAVTPATPSIGVTFNGSVTETDNNLQIVFANNLENTTVADGSDYNRWPHGMLDMLKSTSVHSLASSSVAKWAPAYSDTGGGRLTHTKLTRAAQEIMNKGGGKMDTVYWAQGVRRDVEAQERAAVRWSSSMGMELESSVKKKGVTFFDSRRVPPGYTFCEAKKTHRKMTLINKPNAPGWEDAEKLEGRSGFVFTIDFPYALVTLNRQNQAYFSGLTES